MAAGITAMELGAKGPNICVTTACTSGTHSIGEALMLIQTGRAKVMIAGGAEAALSHLSYAGFGKMKALCSQFANEPTRASRPFDKNRCGFVMGEGAGVLILEDLEFAKARGARIYAELSGYGMSGDAYHMTSPAPGGEGAVRAMAQALKTAGLNPEDIGYINAHGTSTEANDANETAAIKTLFRAHARDLNISSTKSMTGHLLGAAGGIEAVFSVMALHTGIVPPTINYENPDPECDLNYTPNKAVERRLNAVISNSFGFGGTNGCIAFSAFK
jgi:3-oxoacyl-[acyl-carrier-protein] synthase II